MNACVHRLDFGLFSHPNEVLAGMESEPMITPRKNPLYRKKKSPQKDRTHDVASSRTASQTHYQMSYSGPFSDQTCSLSHSQYTDTGPNSPSAYPITPGAWQDSHRFVCWLVGCLTSQQHASVSQRRIYSENRMCCHTEIEVADPTFYLTQSQYIDTGSTSPTADPIPPGAWQGCHWSANF